MWGGAFRAARGRGVSRRETDCRTAGCFARRIGVGVFYVFAPFGIGRLVRRGSEGATGKRERRKRMSAPAVFSVNKTMGAGNKTRKGKKERGGAGDLCLPVGAVGFSDHFLAFSAARLPGRLCSPRSCCGENRSGTGFGGTGFGPFPFGKTPRKNHFCRGASLKVCGLFSSRRTAFFSMATACSAISRHGSERTSGCAAVSVA